MLLNKKTQVMSLFNKMPSNVTKDRKWVEAELSCANALYEKIKADAESDPDFELPSPVEFLGDSDEYTKVWEAFKERLLAEYTMKHAETLAYKKSVQAEKVDYYTRTPEENEAAFVKRAEDIASGKIKEYVIPESFEEDTIALREFLGSEMCSYLGLLIELKRIVDVDFPDLCFESELSSLDSGPSI